MGRKILTASLRILGIVVVPGYPGPGSRYTPASSDLDFSLLPDHWRKQDEAWGSEVSVLDNRLLGPVVIALRDVRVL